MASFVTVLPARPLRPECIHACPNGTDASLERRLVRSGPEIGEPSVPHDGCAMTHSYVLGGSDVVGSISVATGDT